MPAFLVAIRNPAAELTAVEITYLSPGGRRTSRLKLSRKTIGVMEPSSAVRVDPVGPELLVAEGFWTTLSARQRVGVPAWSLTCTRNMRSFVPPDEVQVLHIARDNGADGTNAADTLAHRARGLGKTVIGHAPLARFDDFNSWHMAHLGLTG
ncbi:MAG: hypothetical protein B7Z12_17790 [Caulobacter vibrioides]|uniref:Toprim domain-containing protein n=1 Tax=Caulobacter vibrioides TaxID=155892 RepID=A0A258CW67_CAUVI|nr:MAG: hypothetical protein B7Z12_17790 [Caulobacter vibrioides]